MKALQNPPLAMTLLSKPAALAEPSSQNLDLDSFYFIFFNLNYLLQKLVDQFFCHLPTSEGTSGAHVCTSADIESNRLFL